MGQRKDFFQRSSFLDDEGKAADRVEKGALKGRIMALADIGIANSNSRHLLAKNDTQGGTIATVDLGPAKDLNQLNLQQGDVVKVYGVRSNIDNRAILVANSLQTSGERLKIDRSTVRPLKKFQARILKTKELSQKGKSFRIDWKKIQKNKTKTKPDHPLHCTHQSAGGRPPRLTLPPTPLP